VLAGLLTATYVATPAPTGTGMEAPTRRGLVGGIFTFFAVGCPVCNKLVLLALGTSGAMTWFEPVQPVLQLLAMALLVWALRARLRGENSCAVPSAGRANVAVPLVVAGVALLVAGAMSRPSLLGGDSAGEPTGSAAEVSREGGRPPLDENDPLLQVIRREAGDPRAMGDVDAPVVMVNYSDFQCPFCGKFARDTEPVLIERYVDEGTLRIEWRDFPYLGPESETAARAGWAAGAQDKFWAFHDAMYADQQPPNSGKLTPAYLTGIAEKVGLDVARFRKDMASKEASSAVQRDFAEGQRIGVTGTPAFLVNGMPVMGAQPTDVFVELIEQAEAQAQ
jgi:protein-disulfide isomerase